VKLISPFVGRIYDWHKKNMGAQWNEAAHFGANDPGVQSVTSIFHYYKKFNIATEIMGASFRNIGQIQALAGCDLLTISPELLDALQHCEEDLQPALQSQEALNGHIEKITLTQASFLARLKENPMACQKLEEGIASFCADALKIEQLLTL
jgi:transaldolase